jgi:hypothetical protein
VFCVEARGERYFGTRINILAHIQKNRKQMRGWHFIVVQPIDEPPS